MISTIDPIRKFCSFFLKFFIKDKDERREIERTIIKWILNNPIYRFIDKWTCSIVWTMWALFHYKFDYERIMREVDLKRRDMKRELIDVEDENRILTYRLNELKKKEERLNELNAAITIIEDMYKDADTRK